MRGEKGCKSEFLRDIPGMAAVLTTKIDERSRPGALSGLVQPGQRYEVERISASELRMRLLAPKERPKPYLIKRGGLTLLAGTGVVTHEDVQKALEDFP